jgi:hypothetical protein
MVGSNPNIREDNGALTQVLDIDEVEEEKSKGEEEKAEQVEDPLLYVSRLRLPLENL